MDDYLTAAFPMSVQRTERAGNKTRRTKAWAQSFGQLRPERLWKVIGRRQLLRAAALNRNQ